MSWKHWFKWNVFGEKSDDCDIRNIRKLFHFCENSLESKDPQICHSPPRTFSFYSVSIFNIVFLHKNLSFLVGVLNCFFIQYIYWHHCLHSSAGVGLENASLHACEFEAQRCKWSRAKKCWIEQTTQSSTHHSGTYIILLSFERYHKNNMAPQKISIYT